MSQLGVGGEENRLFILKIMWETFRSQLFLLP